MPAHPRPPRLARPRRGRMAACLGLAGAVLAPVLLASVAPATAGPPSPGDERAGATQDRTVVGAASAPAGSPEGYLFGAFAGCRPRLEVSSTTGAVSIRATDQGWYSSAGRHDADNRNFIVGTAAGFGVFRDFFVFDTTAVTGSVTAASLIVPDGCTTGAGGLGTLRLSGLTTPVETLRAGHTDAVDVFADLGHGPRYGQRVVRDVADRVSVALNTRAMARLAAPAGELAIGGRYWEAPRATLTSAGGRDRAPGQRTRFVARVVGAADDPTPQGTVAFRAHGRVLRGCGAVSLSGTVATARCRTAFAGPGRHRVVARYAGRGVHAPAAGSASVRVSAPPPSIIARRRSTDRPSSTGWYAAPVTVRYSCASRYRLAAGACPGPRRVVLDGSRRVRRGVVDPQGQRTTVTVRVKVDTARPWLRLRRTSGATTGASVPTLGCSAGDGTSGLAAPCTVSYRYLGAGDDGARRYRVTGAATDRADNTRRRRTVVDLG